MEDSGKVRMWCNSILGGLAFLKIKDPIIIFYGYNSKNLWLNTSIVLFEVFNDSKKGKPEDKLRLFIMYLLSVENISQEDFIEYKNALIVVGCTIECLDYLRNV
ncbi:hypothetical protein U3516DRAFT_788068 [Neocallimastix sp. 'constans']